MPGTVLCGLPLFHVNGQLVTGLQPWMRGDHVVIRARPEGYRGKNVIARFWEIVSRYARYSILGCPDLLRRPDADARGRQRHLQPPVRDLWRPRRCRRPSSAFSEAKTGVKILEGYGLAEAACVSSVNPAAGERRAGSIGLPILSADGGCRA